ncbi:glycosyltransferase family 4 protein [Carnobacterium inhibens]|uniref:Glycosyltransferase n=1 Tax=Carnobacterium inhibens TaxID=147709 RepID=A0ABR7TD57_9LACT|nr:glycosyltransferase family 4 protein [Carnobacterium inhibens]MBC9825914.1 glycosyltransferase [Carnobacterium inhibens]
MKKKYTILLAHNYYKLNGGEDTVFKNEKEMLIEQGHKVVTYSRSNIEINNFSILGKLLFPLNSIFSLKTYKDVTKIIQKEKVDIVHVHNTWPLISPSIFYAASHIKIPIVQTIHNFRMICPGATLYYNGKINEDALNEGLWAVTKQKVYKNSLFQTLISALTLKVHRIMGTYKLVNFIFLTDFNKGKHLELNKDKLILNRNMCFVKPNFSNSDNEIIPFSDRKDQYIYVGRLDVIKGIKFLVKSWRNVKNSKLIICGSGPEEKWIKEYITDNKLENIILKGNIDNKAAIEYISESKALILPTKWYEGFPMTILEAYSCGTPVIGSNIGNVGNIILNNYTGKTIKPNSTSDLLASLNMTNEIATNCTEIYNKLYTKEKNYKQLIDIYTQCINKLGRNI